MKEKILAELKKQFPGLQTEFLGFIATKLEAKVTEETQIEGAITELNAILPITDQANFFQSESDRRVTTAVAKAKADAKKPEPPKDDQKKDDPKNEPKDLESFKSIIAGFEKKLEDMQKEKVTTGLFDKLKSKMAEKKIPLKFANGRVIESEDQLDTILAEVESDFEEVKQELANEGFKNYAPNKSNSNASKQASKEDVEDVVNNII